MRTPSLPSALSRGIGTGKEGIIREGIIGKVYGHYQINEKEWKKRDSKIYAVQIYSGFITCPKKAIMKSL